MPPDHQEHCGNECPLPAHDHGVENKFLADWNDRTGVSLQAAKAQIADRWDKDRKSEREKPGVPRGKQRFPCHQHSEIHRGRHGSFVS